MRLVAQISNLENDELQLVFSGGTSLSKAYGLIQRFSEDLDFKLTLPETGISRATCRHYRDLVVKTVLAAGDWTIDGDIQSRNASRFFSCSFKYLTNFTVAPALRPHIKLDVSFLPPSLPPEIRPLRSFVAEARSDHPEVPEILCVVPAETAADKLSTLSRQVLTRQRGAANDDATFIRHLHDLAALEIHTTKHPDFPDLAHHILTEEATRGGVSPEIAVMKPKKRLAATLEALETDSHYPAEYERFVLAMSYAAEGKTPTFEQALESVSRIGASVT